MKRLLSGKISAKISAILAIILLFPPYLGTAAVARSLAKNDVAPAQSDAVYRNKGVSLARATDSDRLYGLQAAAILGIEREVKEVLDLKKAGGQDATSRERLVALRSRILRKILIGSIETDVACEKIEREITFTYDLLRKEEAALTRADDLFNLANFFQFGTLYSLEAYSRLQGKFQNSAIMTGIASGLGIAIPVTKIAYTRFHKTAISKPTNTVRLLAEGKGVDEIKLPASLEKYLNTAAPGSKQSRRRKMYDLWQSRYGTDTMASTALLSLLDGKSKSSNELYNRIVHLWSLYSYVRDFDYELLALLRLVQSDSYSTASDGSQQDFAAELKAIDLSAGGLEMAKLIGAERDVITLVELNKQKVSSVEKRELELAFLEKVLSASFETRAVIARIKEEMNYSYDVVLASLLQSRLKKLQLVYDINFIQTGTFGCIASLLYLQGRTMTGNLMFLIGPSSIGTALTTVGLVLLRGGKKTSDMPPNSLAAFFDMDVAPEYRLSPFVLKFLDSPCPQSKDRLTHRQELREIWKQRRVSTVDLEKEKERKKLASANGITRDTIKIVSNRVVLLDSLRIQLQLVYDQLFDLVQAVEQPDLPKQELAEGEIAYLQEKNIRTANLLGLGYQVREITRLRGSTSERTIPAISIVSADLNDRFIEVTRTLTRAMLDSNRVSARLEVETVIEQTALDRLTRYRDLSMQITNLLNFYQIGILGIIIDGPLGQTPNFANNQAGNILTLISGMGAASLGALAFLQRRGGVRLKKPPPNMLGPVLNVDSSGKDKYTPLLLTFLSSLDYDSSEKLTYKAVLIKYWREAGVLTIKDVTKQSSAQKLAASGSHHHWWNENIKLLRNRVTMMHDLKSILNLIDGNIADFADALD